MPHWDKVIVTNNSALRVKYGSGFKLITAALKRLIAADKKRGLKTKLVALDSRATMKALGGKAVTVASEPRQNKAAIDAVFLATTPDYLVLLGAIDVIPHQDLKNPITDDDDPFAYGDIPYACEAPYSQRIQDFRGPTRVIGRIPDLTNGRDPKYLVGLLEIAAKFTSATRADYEAHLGISAKVWSASTELSLTNTFGAAKDLQRVPPKAAKWLSAQLKSRAHFINCHGGPADPHFYGQQGQQYPIAHDAAYLKGRVAAGTVVSAECCYGAELYDPTLAGGQMGICSTYLANGAYGFFGSTTTAYGPTSGNGAADLICQYFLQRVLLGSSLGRAALEARQHFVRGMSVLDPADLKTLAQFNLLGDPAVVPVRAPSGALVETRAYRKAVPESGGLERARRRELLTKAGVSIAETSGSARLSGKLRMKARFRSALETSARQSGLRDLTFASYTVEDPAAKTPLGRKRFRAAPTAFHVAVGRPADHLSPVRPIVLIVATEAEGKIVGLRRLHSR
jgi:hypothetical protein